MRVGVSFSIPIEEIIDHVEMVLSKRANLKSKVDAYERVLDTMRSVEDPTAAELSTVLGRLSDIRKGLLEADQAMEDTVNILQGYVGYLQQKEAESVAAPVEPPDQPAPAEQPEVPQSE